MKILRKKELYKGKYLRLFERKFLTGEGKKGKWEYIQRKNAVMVFALTKEKEVILEKIYRIPIKSYVVELPAGLLDKERESKAKAAKRELLEETGYLAKKLIFINSVPVDAASQTTELFLFFAPDVKYIGRKKSEDTEEIEILKVPLGNLLDFLSKPPKKIKVDLRIFSILPLLGRKSLI